MPIDISNITAERKRLTLTVGGDTMWFEYAPGRYNPAFEAKLEEISKSQFQSKALVAFFEELEFTWGDVYKDGEPFPATRENLMQMPVELLSEILGAIGEDNTVSSEEGKD